MLPFHDEPMIRENIIAKILFACCLAKISYRENFPVYGMQYINILESLIMTDKVIDHVSAIISSYQFGFLSGKSTVE